MKDWTQSGEQAMILEWADRRPSHGRFLDCGATDGIAASNTRALALRGWGGVLVEPAAWAFEKLTETYGDREDIDLVQAALVVEPSPLVRWHYAHDLLSTTEDAYMERWAVAGVTFTPTYVAAVTVAQFLDVLPGPYDLVSIDVEGGSLAIWDELRRLDAFAPGALVVVEAEDGGERWQIQRACLEGWARIGTTPNNVLLERLSGAAPSS